METLACLQRQSVIFLNILQYMATYSQKNYSLICQGSRLISLVAIRRNRRHSGHYLNDHNLVSGVSGLSIGVDCWVFEKNEIQMPNDVDESAFSFSCFK